MATEPSLRYFAYGRNMASAVMDLACPGHRYLGRAELADHRLAFTRRSLRTGTGVADILPTPGRSVWGALYQLAPSDLAAIDQKEGNGWAYQRRAVIVRLDAGKPDAGRSDSGKPSPDPLGAGQANGERRQLQAFAYSVIAPEPQPIAPSAEYRQALLDGARQRGLPADYLARLVAGLP